MATATIVGNAYVQNGMACLHVVVAEGGQAGNVEYRGCVPYDAAFQALSLADKRTALIAACKAQRDAQVTAQPSMSVGAGTVTV